jgi:nucleotide-binding universal stress UspA family protein
MLPIRTIIHPTDFSDRSNYAFRLACSLARDHGSKLLVVHVLPPPAVAYGEVITGLSDAMYREQAKQQLEKLMPTDPKVTIEHQLLDGDPAAEVIELARQTHADLIVMGTHGRGGLGRLLMGSVAEQIVRKAPCAVLSVKMPFPEESAAPPAGSS